VLFAVMQLHCLLNVLMKSSYDHMEVIVISVSCVVRFHIMLNS
jgi:hypothetical protein